MNKLILSVVILLASFGLTFAQDKKPEFFGGYSFESVDSAIKSSDLGTTTTLDNRFNANGFNLAGTGYLTKRFGLTADFSGHYNTRNDTFAGSATGQSKLSLYNLTGGPTLRFPGSGRVTPFVHALAGFARRNFTETFGTTSTSDNTTSFAMNLGGGLDVKLNKRIAWRLIQADYNPIFVRARTVSGTPIASRTLSGFRLSTGIVIK